MTAVPIFQVLENGASRRVGEWRGSSRTLVLETEGFPQHAPGEHQVAGDLPWIFWDMCPSGFLGRAFQRQFPELGLQNDPRRWTAAECLRALTLRGYDLSGNLLVGEASLLRWQEDVAERRARMGPRRQILPDGRTVEVIRHVTVDVDIDAWLAREDNSSPSSLGGDRPKLLLTEDTGESHLLKYSPPISTPMGRRWSDLLAAEHECARTLAGAGLQAVSTRLGARAEPSGSSRRVLNIERFDRLRGFGRRGASTLYHYAMDRLGDVAVPAPDVVKTLVADGHLPSEAHATVSLVHEFSRAIGNDDAHLGNYGLVFDERGAPALAPFFDVLPMALAPRHDELPDARLRPVPPTQDARVVQLVEAFAARLEASEVISAEFKTLWRTMTGRG